jgi:multiple sugar transport system substrate-binding protein
MNRLSTFIIASTLALCVDAEAQERLVISSFYPLDKVSGWNGIVEQFKVAHPSVEIEVQITPIDQFLQKLTSQIAGGDAPDIAGIENSVFPQFVSRNILEDLTPYLGKTQGFTTADFFPKLIDRYTVEGKAYGIPYDAQPRAMLFYNPGLFEEAGVKIPTAEWTWDDLRSAAKALTTDEGGERRYGFCMGALPYDSFTYLLYGAGGGFVDDLRKPQKATLDQQPAVDASQMYLDLMYTDKSMPTVQSMEAMGNPMQGCKTLFRTGRTAMMFGGMWLAVESPQEFKDLGVKVVMAPVRDTKVRVYPTGGTGYGILRTAKNKELAWEFITQFLGEAGYRSAYREAKLGAIYAPAHVPSFNWYATQPIEFIDSLKPNQAALDYIRFAPFSLNWGEVVATCIRPDLDLILRKLADVKPTLEKINGCVEANLIK